MSFWNRLQKSFPRTHRAESFAVGVAEAVVPVGLLWGLQKWGPKPLDQEKTFKELHQPRNHSYDKDDDAPGDFQ